MKDKLGLSIIKNSSVAFKLNKGQESDFKLSTKPDEIEIVNDGDKQAVLIRSMIEYLYGWIEDNPGLRMSIVDSINYNIACVEVFWLDECNSDLHSELMSEGREEDMYFEEAFQTLQSSFDNIIFNQ
jgi:hypothetical protein